MKQFINNYKKTICLVSLAFIGFPMLTNAQVFTDAVVDSVVVTPVKLISFSASKVEKNVQVNWTTANEKNVSHFNIQRSNDGVNFENIGRTNLASNHNYVYTDVNVPEKNLYYRLETVDADGKTTLSNTVLVKYAKAKTEDWSIYPNPVISKIFSIDCKNLPVAQYQIQLKGIKGETVFTKTITINNINNTIAIQLPTSIAKGLYILTLTSVDASISTSKKVIIE